MAEDEREELYENWQAAVAATQVFKPRKKKEGQ
jgi:hypothetical protein